MCFTLCVNLAIVLHLIVLQVRSTCAVRTGACEILNVEFSGSVNTVYVTYTLNITDVVTSLFTEQEIFDEQVSRAEANTFLANTMIHSSSIALGRCKLYTF